MGSQFDLEDSNNVVNAKAERKQKIWKEFYSKSTLHGLHYIFDDRPRFFRMAWLLIMLSMFGLFIWHASTLFMSFLQYRVSSKVRIVYNESVQFPAITFCNENMYRQSKINRTDFWDILKLKHPLNFSSEKAINWEIYKMSSANMTEIVRNASHELRYDSVSGMGMLYSCIWNRNRCSSENFTETLTEMGLCYTFNSDNQVGDRQINSPGDKYGLRVIMSVDQEEYNGFVSRSSGLRILVHDQNEPPLVKDFGFSVMPRSHVYAAISKHNVKSLPTPYETMCEDKVLPGTKIYSKSACIEFCKERYVISKCGCRAFYMRGLISDENPPFCNVSRYFQCVNKYEEEFDYNEKDHCECTEPCDLTYYTTKLSYGQFPSIASIKLYEKEGENKWKLENDLVAIDLYFERLDFHVLEQVAVYDIESLVGELGGLLGLFLGASLTTVLEIVDFLFQLALSSLASFTLKIGCK